MLAYNITKIPLIVVNEFKIESLEFRSQYCDVLYAIDYPEILSSIDNVLHFTLCSRILCFNAREKLLIFLLPNNLMPML